MKKFKDITNYSKLMTIIQSDLILKEIVKLSTYLNDSRFHVNRIDELSEDKCLEILKLHIERLKKTESVTTHDKEVIIDSAEKSSGEKLEDVSNGSQNRVVKADESTIVKTACQKISDEFKSMENDLIQTVNSNYNSSQQQLSKVNQTLRVERETKSQLENKINSMETQLTVLSDHLEKLLRALRIEASKRMTTSVELEKERDSRATLQNHIQKQNDLINSKNKCIDAIKKSNRLLEEQLVLMDARYYQLKVKLSTLRSIQRDKLDKANIEIIDYKNKFSFLRHTYGSDFFAPLAIFNKQDNKPDFDTQIINANNRSAKKSTSNKNLESENAKNKTSYKSKRPESLNIEGTPFVSELHRNKSASSVVTDSTHPSHDEGDRFMVDVLTTPTKQKKSKPKVLTLLQQFQMKFQSHQTPGSSAEYSSKENTAQEDGYIDEDNGDDYYNVINFRPNSAPSSRTMKTEFKLSRTVKKIATKGEERNGTRWQSLDNIRELVKETRRYR